MKQIWRRRVGLLSIITVLTAGCGHETKLEQKTASSRLRLSPIPPSAVAELGQDTSLELDRFGPLTQHLQIQVPEYRGIEPKVALSYSSAPGTNGILGVGWTLLPFVSIERKSRLEGTALLRSDDRYFIGGNELISCSGNRGDAPSCVMGGTHAAKSETFEKIVFEESDTGGTWTIWNGKGTKTIFRNAIPANKPVEWQLSEVRDANDNLAQYSYSCIDLHCVPLSVEYAQDGQGKVQYQVMFAYEARPDIQSAGTAYGLQVLARRLASIEVRSFGAKVRGYNFDYDPSTTSPASFLKAVTQFGSDATLGSNRRYTGVSLPSSEYSRFTPTSLLETYEQREGIALPATPRTTAAPFSMFLRTGINLLRQAPFERLNWSAQDVDGVPGADISMRWSVNETSLHHPDGGVGTVQRSNTWASPYGGFAPSTAIAPLPPTRVFGPITKEQIYRIDIDKDGLPDELIFNGGVSVSRATSATSFAPTVHTSGLGLPTGDSLRTISGDFDGDGRTDLIVYDRSRNALSNAVGGPCQLELQHCDLGIDRLHLVTILDNGQARRDLISANVGSTAQARQTMLSIPMVVSPPAATAGNYASALPIPEWIAMDVDGDQVTDLVLAELVEDATMSGTHVALRLTTHHLRESGGNFVLRQGHVSTIRNWAPIALNMAGVFFGVDFDDSSELTERLSVGDFDGDGRQDLLFLRPTLRSNNSEPSWLTPDYTFADLQLSFSVLRSSEAGFAVAQQIHTGESIALLPSYAKERMDNLTVACDLHMPNIPNRLECAAIRQWVGFTSAVNVVDLNGDDIDDILIGEEIDLDQHASEYMRDDGHGLPVTIFDSNFPASVLKIRKLLMNGSSVLEDSGSLSTAPDLFAVTCHSGTTVTCGALRAPGLEGYRGPPPDADPLDPYFYYPPVEQQALWPGQYRMQVHRPVTAIPVLHWVFGDLNGDDVTDIAVVDDSGLALLSPDGFPVGSDVAQVVVVPSTGRADKADRVVEIAISAEGIPDYLRLSPNTDQQHLVIRTKNGQAAFDVAIPVGRLSEVSIGDVGSFGSPLPDGIEEVLVIGQTSATAFFLTQTPMGITVQSEPIFGVTRGDRWMLSDLDGNGAQELVRFDYAQSQLTVRSMNRSFSHVWTPNVVQTVLVARGEFGSADWTITNVDGDRFSDFVRLTPSALSVVTQNTGYTTPVVTQTVDLGKVGSARFSSADVNGDGLNDFSRTLWEPSAGAISISQLINVGTANPNYGVGRFLPGQFTIPRPAGFSGTPAGRWLRTDAEADGAEDAVQVDFAASGAAYVNVLHRVGERSGTWTREALQFTPDKDVGRLETWDLDSDGRADISTQASAADGLRIRGLRTQLQAATIAQVKNGYGLTTEVKYRSSLGNHSQVPSGSKETLVSSIESWVEPTGEHSKIGFSYDGFLYDFENRKFRSFATATAELSSYGGGDARPTLSIVNDQTEICAGKRISDKFEMYVDSRRYERIQGSVNQRCTLVEELSVRSEPHSNPRATRTTYAYDLYGQILFLNSDGIFEDPNNDGVDDFPDDNRSVQTTYYSPGSSTYLTGFPKESFKRDSQWNRVEWEQFAYDGNSFGTAPLKGNRSQKSVFDDARPGCFIGTSSPPANCWATWHFDYWPNGLIHWEITPGGVETETVPDSDIGIFIEKSCNAAFCIERTWNRLFGGAESATEASGSKTLYHYDRFGRIERTDFSDGGCTTKKYQFFGNASKQHVVDGLCVFGGGENGGITEVESYFDGLMRPYSEVRSGTYEKQTRYWGTTILRRSGEPWHFIGQSVQPAEMFYDLLGRPVRVRYPDGAETHTSYFTGLRVDHDEAGNESDTELDGFGNPIVVREWNYTAGRGWYPIDTVSRFDESDRRIEVTDAMANRSDWKYSSLGLCCRASCLRDPRADPIQLIAG